MCCIANDFITILTHHTDEALTLELFICLMQVKNNDTANNTSLDADKVVINKSLHREYVDSHDRNESEINHTQIVLTLRLSKTVCNLIVLLYSKGQYFTTSSSMV